MAGLEKRVIRKGQEDDLVLLETISEDGIIGTLKARFENDMLYTYIGATLISVNPYKWFNKLYTPQLMQRYYGKQKFENAPHVFATAEEAYRNLLTMGRDQAVLVSGESGAGKTEAAKQIMSYISQVSDDRAEQNESISVRDIKDALLQSNPVLEAFGNATTLRNDNSSRFGKYMVIQMDYSGVPIGGNIKTYLLEKPRVVGQQEGERSFHIFYQLCASGTCNLGNASKYNYTKTTTSTRSIDDSKDFKVMDSAMSKVGVKGERKQNLYNMVAGVLHLGNVEFETSRGDKCVVTRGSSDALATAARFFEVQESDLARALTHRTIQNRKEVITSPLTQVDECVKTRDALAKAIYSRGFLRLVDFINESIHTDMKELALGVLDIYGFEILRKNSFEQLCINYCNEKLQQLFIELTLKTEQEEYAREGIRWNHIDYFDNAIVCDLIESRKPAGVMAYLDEECIYPKGTDKSFLRKIDTQLTRHPHYESLATKTNNDPDEFLIKHYAGEVVYSVEGMLDKNKDTLFRDLIMVIGRGSRNEFFNSLFPEAQQEHDGKKPITAGTQFVKNMQHLIADLEKCEPHYVRTIKPNDSKRAGVFETDLVRHQVRYLGLQENVRVRRAGFAYRSDYTFFVRRYKMVTPKTWPLARGSDKSCTDAILNALHISDFEEGKTKVFIREPQSVFTLEEARDKALHMVAKIIQKAYRAFKARVYFLRLREESAKLFNKVKRRRASFRFYYLGDYIFAQDNPQITEQIIGRVKFADTASMMNTKGQMVRHIVVITKNTIYLFTPMYKLVHQIVFASIRSWTLSTNADGFMLIDTLAEQNAKPPPTIILESMRKTEITTLLYEEFPVVVRKDLPLKFIDSTEVTVVKKSLFGSKILQKTLRFNEAPHLKKSGTHVAVSKKDGVDPKTEMAVLFAPDLGSQAKIQLDDDVMDLISIHRTAPGVKKKLPYQNFRSRR